MKTPLVAILRGITAKEVDIHIPILIDAGFDAIEIPLNSPDWATSIAIAVKNYGEKTLIGAGTVLDVISVDKLAKLGCRLIVTPNTNSDVIKQAIKYGMEILPGCATATEAFIAIAAGASKIKLFPSSVFGPDYIRALKSVLPPQIQVFAVGGVTPDNLAEYMQAGCVGAGLGSDLYRAGQSAEITKSKALAFIASYQNAKKN
ncbi:2-dehydro-3-deoxy-6-phosphogalactonate aldolase [Yersinia pekkanenii]|uniref:Keto-hydroxyglutarate-aldolase/keto-deoxy-phosphogluconate aldolase n=1 Tax=Yersinia pekkanenii TaxID=1288385 RepID=A0A0T9NNQ3_9GAMM|nr:2-dehydro-3-deoxy-6-phosphogalactonate aldolase [Yersinia pekkanenii]CNH19917.1 keto-hydroxyglutarate-aldolase/keto-deoxy-phosphogluconate aldolase [Yersinia pekkanenii]CRY66036.1 keto-hydroxyglutarate-aldolase/keto-deoxy-phosphogluconate aldolase [Yersinia pekkanenii]